MRLAIVSDLPIWKTASGFRAAPPGDAVEINALRQIAGCVALLGVTGEGAPPPHALPLDPRIRVVQAPPAGGRGLRGKALALFAAVRSLPGMLRTLDEADLVQLRCPSKLGGLALLLLALPWRRPRIWARWGGEWGPRHGEPLSYRLQRRALRAGFAGAAVTAVGLDGPPNPTRPAAALAAAERATRDKRLRAHLRLLFVGRLAADKGAAQVLSIGAALAKRGWPLRIDFCGDGPERDRLERLACEAGLGDAAVFHGWLSPSGVDLLAADAHFVLLPSATEGFPRALHEAMAHRCVPLASPVGAIPAALGALDPRLLQPADRPELWADQLERLALDPDEWRRLAEAAQQRSSRCSVEAYRAATVDFLERTFGARRTAAAAEATR